MWEYYGQMEHLYEALLFYRAAYQRNPEQDGGYGGVNAAYSLQRLAHRARAAAKHSGTAPIEAKELERQASDLRLAIVNQLDSLLKKDPSLENQYWFVATLAEALFGLGQYKETGHWLAQSKKLEVSEWERQTTFRQLVSIAKLQDIEPPREVVEQKEWPEVWQALANVLGDRAEKALCCYPGKVGLALSGGGFRASLYHLGVLARLAEMDVLRSVEVLSTVSGGSIIGVQYYLEVKNLLETKMDDKIGREDYVEIVRRLQKNFLEGIQQNIRRKNSVEIRAKINFLNAKLSILPIF